MAAASQPAQVGGRATSPTPKADACVTVTLHWQERGDGSIRNKATLGAARLKEIGIAASSIQPAPSPMIGSDRDYSSGAALHRWVIEHGCVPVHLTVATGGACARCTRLLFQKAFGSATKVGVIAVPEQGFDPARWWTSSQGFRVVTDELIAYLHAVVFRPA